MILFRSIHCILIPIFAYHLLLLLVLVLVLPDIGGILVNIWLAVFQYSAHGWEKQACSKWTAQYCSERSCFRSPTCSNQSGMLYSICPVPHVIFSSSYGKILTKIWCFRHSNASTSWISPSTLCMNSCPLPRFYRAMKIRSHCGSSHHHPISRSASFVLVRYKHWLCLLYAPISYVYS